MKRLSAEFGSSLRTVYSTRASIADLVKSADLVIGAVLLPGAAAPKLVTRDMLKTMRPGAVIVDIAIDQGGCCETSKPTTHSHPTYVVDGIVHYCVANMPGAVARTSTFALNHATLPFALALADKGWREGARGRSPPARRPERARRQAHLRAGRGGAWARLHAGRDRACGVTAGAGDTTGRRELAKGTERKRKSAKGNERNFAFISFQQFFRIGRYQWVTANKNKKNCPSI